MKSSFHSLIHFLPSLLNHLRLLSQDTPSITIWPVSQSYITTDGQSASLSWKKHPSGAYDQIFSLSDHCGFLIWGALSDERTGLSFTIYNIQYILLSQIWDQVPVFISPRSGWPGYTPRHCLGSSLYNLGAAPTENTASQQFLYCYRGVSTSPLHINGSSSIVARVFISAGTWLSNRCVAMNCSGFQTPWYTTHRQVD
jgi:hypothetical protein